MKTLYVLQHVEAEYLGLIEDHLEARAIRFRYARPFVAGGRVPETAEGYDGLILLGGGPYGVVSGSLLPSLAAELRLTADFLDRGLPVVGLNLGSVILATAAGGGAMEAPLRFAVGEAKRTGAEGLACRLPERFPLAVYMRDRPALPESSMILATDPAGEAVAFHCGQTGIGFVGHPGFKSAMVEDLIMASETVPEGTAETLADLRQAQPAIAEALSEMMVGLIAETGWMSPDPQ